MSTAGPIVQCYTGESYSACMQRAEQANTLSQIPAYQLQAAGVPSGITGNESTSTPVTGSYSDNMFSSLGDYLNNTKQEIENTFSNPFGLGQVWQGILFPGDKPTSPLQAQGANSALGQASASLDSLLSIVTDIPRMLTIIIGLILLVTGLFALASHSQTIVEIGKSVAKATAVEA